MTNGSNAVVHTGHSGASRKLVLADEERNSQGFTGQEDFQVPRRKHVARPGMSRTAAISNMSGRSSPEKEAQQRPQLKRLPKNAAAMNSDVQKHHLPGAG